MSQMYPFALFIGDFLSTLVIVLGLLVCSISGIDSNLPPSERRRTVGIGGALVVLGILGFIWKGLVLLYPILVIVALVVFAGVGVYRVFKSSTQTPD